MNDPKVLLERFQPKEAKKLDLDRQLLVLRFSPCGQYLAAGDFDGKIRRWKLGETGAEVAELPALEGHHGWLQAFAFAPSPGRFYSADSWGQLRGWKYEADTATEVWKVDAAHNGWIRTLDISADGALVATGGFDKKIRVWSAETGEKRHEFDADGDVYALRFHPNGKSLFSGDHKGLVRQWDFAAGKGIRDFDAGILFTLSRLQDTGGVRCLAFDAEGKTLVCGGTSPKNGGSVTGIPTLLIFDVATGELKQKLEHGSTNDVYICEAAFHPAGFVMAVLSGQPGSGFLLFHQPGDEKPFLAQKLVNTHSLTLHPDGRRLAVSATSGGSNGNGRVLKNGEYVGNTSPIHLFELPAPA